MQKGTFDGTEVNKILEKTIGAINQGKSDIVDIVEGTRNECELIKKELAELQDRARKIIDEVDKLEIIEKNGRRKLVTVSKNFNRYNENDIREAYEKANNLKVELTLKRQEEKMLIKQRRDLEQRLKNAMELVVKSEKLISRVGVAMEVLTGNLEEILETVEGMNKRQMLGIRIIQAQEEERKRVARDMHDGPAQTMANVVLKTEFCEKLLTIDTERAKEELRKLKGTVRESLRDIRRIIYDLRPMSLDDLGLIPTLQRYAIKFEEDTGINVNVLTFGNRKDVKSVVGIALFRIVQEALTNIKKHSNANRVVIKIENSMSGYNVVVEDDGDGFCTEKIFEDSKENNGFGLIGMKERVELLEGKMGVKSQIGKGTKIIIAIPVKSEEDTSGQKNNSINRR